MHIGILGNEGSWYVADIRQAAEARGHQVSELLFPEVIPSVVSGQIGLQENNVDLSNLDALVVRTMPPGSLEQVVFRMDVLHSAADLGVQVVNSPRAIECAVDKYLTTQRLAAAGLPVPDTIVCEGFEAAMQAFERLGQDVVVKPIFGAEGRGILRIDQPELAHRTFRTLERLQHVIYLQRFLKGDGTDFRLLVLGGRVIASMKRRPAEGDFRANVAQSGSAGSFQPSEEWCQLALKAAAVTGCDFCGVDLMMDESGDPIVIEVNAVPGWLAIQKVCDIHVADQLLQWLEQTT